MVTQPNHEGRLGHHAARSAFSFDNSIKDRMAVKMIEDAERNCNTKPGGTIVEGRRGTRAWAWRCGRHQAYRCIFDVTNKRSGEGGRPKAFGAEISICQTNIDHEDPLVCIRVIAPAEHESGRLEGEPMRQPRTPRRITSRRDQRLGKTDGRITDLAGVGTGGPSRRWEIPEEEPENPRLGHRHVRVGIQNAERPGSSTRTRSTVNHGGHRRGLPAEERRFRRHDHFEKVTDRDAAIMTRRISREGDLRRQLGRLGHGGAASSATGSRRPRRRDLHDHGSRYSARCSTTSGCAGRVPREGRHDGCDAGGVRLRASASVKPPSRSGAVRLMREHDFSQISITHDRRLVGSSTRRTSTTRCSATPTSSRGRSTRSCSQRSLVDISTNVEQLTTISRQPIPPCSCGTSRPTRRSSSQRTDVIRLLC